MIDHMFYINLSIRQDRNKTFLDSFPGNPPVRWEAVHGDSCPHPTWWKSGRGAWGCYRSHLSLLEYCMSRQLNNYIVFEDDAIFTEDYTVKYDQFIKELPKEWDMFYLGGQLLHEFKHPPKKITEWVLKPYNVNRTHCYAVNKKAYQILYSHLNATPFNGSEHIDHHLGRLHEKSILNLYCPKEWLVGQREDSSNISGKFNKTNYWPHPGNCTADNLNRKPVCVFLEAPLNVAKELQELGWHQGYWKNEEGLDCGICAAVSSLQPEIKLNQWYDWTRKEVVRDNKIIPCVYHPNLSWEKVSQYSFTKWIHISATTVEEAVSKLNELQVS